VSDWIGLGFIVLVVVLVLVASARLGSPPRRISVEEFEKRARTGGYTRAGMFGLQQLLNPKAAKAIEVQQDLRHGYYNKKRVPGEGDDEEENSRGEVNANDDANANDEVNESDDVDVSGEVNASDEVLRGAGAVGVEMRGDDLNQTESEERDA
jgi:hypothetical protein